MIKNIENYLDVSSLKEDIRKIGVNFITAGAVGLFATHIANLTLLITITSLLIIFTGAFALFLGLHRGASS